MATKKEKQHCFQYLCDRLEDSGLYQIVERAEMGIVARENTPNGRRIRLLLPNFGGTIPEFRDAVHVSQDQNTYVCPVFYKDGKTAFVRMVERNRSWRIYKSFKNYSVAQVHQMLHLRRIEKAALEIVGGDELQYYQPETSRLEESVRTIQLTPVELDYSHIDPGDQGYGFVHNRDSIDYKLPEEVAPAITGPAKFMYASGKRMAWLMRAAAKAETDPRKN